MADINNVTLSSGNSPTVRYTITYSKSRPNNSQMKYTLTISAALNSSGSYISTGYALLCTITVNNISSSVRIKANDNDNWEGTTPRVRTVSITCPSTTANTAQPIRFKVVSDGRLSLSSGVIDNSNYTVLSSPLLTTACIAPTSCSVNATVSENNATLSWSGAASGTNNAISSYEIQYSESTNNSTFGTWYALSTITTSKTNGTLSVSPPSTRGYYRRFRIRTRGAAGSSYYSAWKISSNSVRKNTLPNPPATVTLAPTVYNTGPITLSWSGALGGTSSIKGYKISVSTSLDSSTWSNWSTVETLDLSASSGSRLVPVSSIPGTYTKFSILTIDTQNAQSTEKISNTVLCVAAASDTPAVIAPSEGSATYNTNPKVLITMGAAPNTQISSVRIGQGTWHNTVNNQNYFSKSGVVNKNTPLVYQAQNLTLGAKTVYVQSFDSNLTAPSSTVSRSFTILPFQLESINPNITKVKASHISYLRNAVNTVREYYSLPIVNWKDIIIKGKTSILMWPYHIIEIRSAIDEIAALIKNYIPYEDISWIPLTKGRPKADVVNQIKNIILTL